jgi:pyrroloquinoline quinone biosynthesis protein B
MTTYLEANGPWGQLVQLENILLRTLEPDRQLELNERVKVKPFLVPHRDEYSETVGYEITLGSKRVLFIPDIDKWQKWDNDIRERISGADLALLDGSFYADGEIQHRPMSEIPHPFVTESMALFDGLEPEVRSRIHFIHFNHTNPLLIEGSDAEKEVIDKGYQVARQGSVLTLSE